MKITNMKEFRSAIAATAAAVGKPSIEIRTNGNRLEMPEYEISLAPTVSNNKRFWRVSRSFRMLSLTGNEDSIITNIIFEEPFGSESAIVRSIAMLIAKEAIDDVLD